MIYLDNNATTRVDDRVLEAMLPFFTNNYGNAASLQHAYGWIAADAVDLARERVAALIGAQKQEIVFTSGATESINLAVKGIFEAYRAKGRHIITVQTEHKAVLDTCAYLERRHGASVTYLPVNGDGMIDLELLERSIRADTILIAVMYANNETGVLQRISEIGAMAKAHHVLFFCDGTQAVGKVPVNVLRDQIDLMSMSGHKIYGPKGVGALYVRRRDPRVTLVEQMNGGGHERAMRSGTLNVPGIVGLGMACELCESSLEAEMARIGMLRDTLEQNILNSFPDAEINGTVLARIPGTTNISFGYPDSNQMLAAFRSDLAVSAGSACTSASNEPSYVLMAMGLGEKRARSAIRIGLGRFSNAEEIVSASNIMVEKIKGLREMH